MKYLIYPTIRPVIIALLASISTAACSTFSTEPVAPMTDAEKAARADELFTVMDINGDGFLTKDEMSGGLKYVSQADGPATRELIYGLKRKTPPAGDQKQGGRPVKKLTEEEIRQLVEQSFKTPDNEAIHRISKDDFKKIVVGRSTSSQAPSSSTWEQIL